MIMTRWARKASSWEATEELQLCFSNALNSYDFLLQQSTSESETSVQCKSLEQTSYLPVNLMVCINLLTFCSRLVWSLRGTESAYASGCDSELTALIFFLNHVSNVNSSTQVYACVCCTSTGSQPRQRRPISKAKVMDDCETEGCMHVPCVSVF
jgi:hypothetical protein